MKGFRFYLDADVGEVMRRLFSVMQSLEAAQLRNRLEFLSNWPMARDIPPDSQEGATAGMDP